MAVRLSERQEQTVGVAITVVSAAVIVVAIGAVLWLVARFLSTFSSVLLPVAVAGIGAFVVRPLFDRLTDRMSRGLALLLVFLAILLPLAGFAWFFGWLAVDQVTDLIERAPELWRRLVTFVHDRMPQLRRFLEQHPLGQKLSQAVEGEGPDLMGSLRSFGGGALIAGAGVVHALGAIASWAVVPVYFAFFLLMSEERPRPETMLPFLKKETRDDVVYLAQEFVNILVAFFRGQLMVAFGMGLLFAIGFTAVGLRYGFILGLLLGLLNIIPYLGSMIGLAITLPLAFFQDEGGMGRLIAVLIVFVVVQLIEGYLLTPKIMGQRTGLHPVVIIFSVFFWGTALDGILGMVLAIPLTAFLVVFWRLVREKYVTELV